MSKEKLGMRIGESIFSIVYLLFDLIAGIIFLTNKENNILLLYGIMALVLGFGDAFHLVPRVIKNIKGETKKVKWWMNLGLLVTSVTMTIFYVILYYVWTFVYTKDVNCILTISVIALALTRIVICFLPNNNWFKAGNKKLSLIRNIVFLILGLIEIILFILLGNTYGIVTAICILLSFAFYMPVTLYSKNNPKIGMLMIPKTIMYVILISLGLTMI